MAVREQSRSTGATGSAAELAGFIDELAERFVACLGAFHMDKADLELETGFRDFEHLAAWANSLVTGPQVKG
jgi:hypothetical protein